MLLYRLSVQCLLCRQMTECLNSSKTISHHDAKMTSWSINLQRNKDVVRIKNKIGKYLYSLIYELVFCEFYVIFLSNGTSNIGYFCCNISILLVWNISIDVFNKYLKSVFVGNYLGRWKGISILKGDASQTRQDRNFSANPSQNPAGAVRYIQQAPVHNASHLVRHWGTLRRNFSFDHRNLQ